MVVEVVQAAVPSAVAIPVAAAHAQVAALSVEEVVQAVVPSVAAVTEVAAEAAVPSAAAVMVEEATVEEATVEASVEEGKDPPRPSLLREGECSSPLGRLGRGRS